MPQPPDVTPTSTALSRLLILALLLPAGCRAAGDGPAAGTDAPAPSTSTAAYVGDAACVDCHAETTTAYRQTNKARALARFDAATAPERFEEAVVFHPGTRLSYEAFVRNDTLFQREYRRDDAGRILHERTHAAAYVIGSGNATRSYLMDAGGYLTEMPLTWYTQRAAWDLSPGYHEANDRFGRQINLECMTCHNAFPRQSPFTQNHYTDVPLGITCERCHGPAARHVAARTAGEARAETTPDPTIVNPAYLDRDTRLSVCQQCHLAGVTIFKAGDDPTTFRPGIPLAAHRTVFVPSGELTDPESVGIDSHPVRLARSACYQQSEMTCGSCHDPHRPKALLAEDHYNVACQQCHSGPAHETTLCARPEAATPEMAATGDCVSCHMRQGGTTNVPHVIFTDHWIRRDPGPPRDPEKGRPAFEQVEPLSLVALQEPGRSAHLIAPRTTNTALDDLEAAAAYLHFYETMHRVPAYIDTVITRGRRGFRRGGDLVDARIALARALSEADSLDAAVTVLDAAAQAYPADAWVHFWRGSFQAAQGHTEPALQSLRQAVALQPLLIEAQVKLADALFQSGRTDEAISQLQTVVRLDPVHRPRSWFNLGMLYLRAGQPEAAEEAFTTAADLDPMLADAQIQLGTLQMGQGRHDEAALRFYRAIVAVPDNPAGYGSLGLLRLQQGRPGEARRLFEQVLKLDPDNPNARALLQQLR